jgi:hypothetical protein
MADDGIDLAALRDLVGTAYRWYRDDGCVRADDQLVRSRAGDALCRAASAVRDAIDDARRAMPAPTRAQPFPNAASSRHLADLRQLHDRVLALETRLRGAGVLPDRDFSALHGVGPALRERLVRCDAALIATADEVACATPSVLPTALAALEAVMEERAAIVRARA